MHAETLKLPPWFTYGQEVVRLPTLRQLSAQARGLANLVRVPEMLNFVYCLSLECSLKGGGRSEGVSL